MKSTHHLFDTDATQSSINTPIDETVRRLGLVWVHPFAMISPLEGQRMAIGRDQACEVALPSQQVSRQHALIENENGGLLLRDLGSKNGVQVNGERIDVASLSVQDVVRVGDWIGVLSDISEAQIESGQATREVSQGLYGGHAMETAFEVLRRIAPSNISVMLVGETGTGKEIIAREIHRLGRRPGQYVAVNCAAIPEQMAEGELFGYKRGAFTGANRANTGHFRKAHQGTLFLDEVSDLDASVQTKMLRALEEKSVVPLGQSTPEEADARIVCATHLPLHEYVEQGVFRDDLYARLNGVELRLPPLRERREEILDHFLRFLFESQTRPPLELSTDFVEQLCIFDWPLNVRQVVQLAARTRALHQEALDEGRGGLSLAHLPPEMGTYCRGDSLIPLARRAEVGAKGAMSDETPRDALAHQFSLELERAQGNVSVAAKRTGISRPMAYRLLKRLQLDPEAMRLKNLIESREG